MNYQIFKQIGGRKTFLVFEKDGYIKVSQAIKEADKYFKAGVKNLYVTVGMVIGDNLYLAETKGKYPIEMGVYNYKCWVVTRA